LDEGKVNADDHDGILVRVGFKKIAALPGYHMPDIYKNYTRPQLPKEMKVSEQADLLMRVCERVILENGEAKIDIAGKPGYRILLQAPRLLEPLTTARQYRASGCY
jgi:hypothetical protein